MTHHRPTTTNPLTPARRARLDRLTRAFETAGDQHGVRHTLDTPRNRAIMAAGQAIYAEQQHEDLTAQLVLLAARRHRLERAIGREWRMASSLDNFLAATFLPRAEVDRKITGDLRRLARLLAAHDRVVRSIDDLQGALR